MKKLLALMLVAGLLVLMFGSSSSTAAPKTDNKTKIVGKWALEKTTNKKPPPPGTVIEFTKDGKLKITIANFSLDGTYKVDGDKVHTTMKSPDGKEHKETITITKLTDKELVTKDEKGNVDTFKKK
jgi:uncharacterized protein (TIGR03066 family)